MQDWAQIFEIHGDGLYRFAYRLCGSREIAEDAVQECFVSWLKSNAFPSLVRGELRPYLYGAVRNQVFKALRRRALPLAMPKLTSPDLSGEVFEALLQLTEEAREALVLVCIEGFTYEEAAPVLDVEIATLRVRVHRARRQLKQLMGIEVTNHD